METETNHYEDCEWTDDVSQLVKELHSIGHHVPLELMALSNVLQNNDNENENELESLLSKHPELEHMNLFIKDKIRLVPFSSLIGKRLFGVQPITECQSCKNYNSQHDCIGYECVICQEEKSIIDNLDLNEHDTISEIIQNFIRIPFWTEEERKELLYSAIKDLAKELMVWWKDDYKMQKHTIEDFSRNNSENSDNYPADICPRLWLFVGDSVLSFETYLLFNSGHGHPHCDNWWLLKWKLSQPPATENFKMIGENITSITVHDETSHNISDCVMKANYDKWLDECGPAKDGWKVPACVYYPILKIVTPIKIIDMGTKWYFCHYPRSLYSIEDAK